MAVENLETSQPDWRKARRSVGNGACVEVASLKGNIVVRDSTVPDSPVISFSASAWHSFLDLAKAE